MHAAHEEYVLTFLYTCLLCVCNRSTCWTKAAYIQGKYVRSMINDVIEAHCYVVDIEWTDREQIRSRINNNWCRTFQPRRPLSTAYKTVDKGLRGWNVLYQLLLILPLSAHDQFARYVRSNCWIILLEEKIYTLLSCWDTLTMCYTHQMKERNHLDCKFVRCTHTLCTQTMTNNSWWFKECICSSHSEFTLAMCMYTCSPSPFGHTGQHSPNVLLHLGTPLQSYHTLWKVQRHMRIIILYVYSKQRIMTVMAEQSLIYRTKSSK